MSTELPTTQPAWPGYRWPHLMKLTEQLLRNDQWPQMDRWLAARFREQKAYGRKDRAFYSDALFRLCRQAAVPVYLQAGYREQQVELDAGTVWSQLQAMPVAEVWSWLVLLDGLDAHLPREIDDAEQRRQYLEQLPTGRKDQLADLTEGWLPAWQDWMTRRREASGWDETLWQHWRDMQMRRPPLWLRVLSGRPTVVGDELRAEGLTVLQVKEAAIAIEPSNTLQRTSPWQQGRIEIQDRASQAIVEAVAPQPGEAVWDVCAGAGGKAVALAVEVGLEGRVRATDVRGRALQETQRRAERLGLSNLTTDVFDATNPQGLPQAGFDAVLVDAPCSSAGTWRRNPDARWRLKAKSLPSLHQLQDDILANVSGGVKPAGRLVYATCSWLVEENEDRVQAFLDNHPDFQLHSQTMLGAPHEDADTMFVAVMTRLN